MPSYPHPLAVALASFAAACAAPSRSPSVDRAWGDASAPLAPPTALEALSAAPAPQTLTALRRDTPVRAPAIGSSRLMLTYQQLDEDFWSPIDKNFAFGFETNYENTDDWLGFEWGGSLTFATDSEAADSPANTELVVDLEMYEGYVGVYRSFLRGSDFRPYVGAGVSFIYWDGEKKLRTAGVTTTQDDRDDVTLGLYVHGGIAVQVGENFQLGIDLRALGGTDADNVFGDGDLDYQRATLFLGFGG